VTPLKVVGIRCDSDSKSIAAHFISLGAEAIVFDPEFICGKDHVLSSYLHAERAFAQGTQRSKNILTETILYTAADRQIGRAIKKMSPKEDTDKFVVLVIGDCDDLALSSINAEIDDSLIECTENSAVNMDLEKSSLPYTELILEHIAVVDVMKY